jgi:hypothetical protein
MRSQYAGTKEKPLDPKIEGLGLYDRPKLPDQDSNPEKLS